MRNTLVKIGVGFGGILVIAFVIFIVITMQRMAVSMEQMGGYMSHMAHNMEAMRGDISIMTSEVSKLDDVVAHMDENINAMNVDINVIQRSMSGDMLIMRDGVVSISKNLENMDNHMYLLTDEVSQMNHKIELMSIDIHRSARSFSSPMNYMRNMVR